MLMSDQRWSSCCTLLSDGKHNSILKLIGWLAGWLTAWLMMPGKRERCNCQVAKNGQWGVPPKSWGLTRRAGGRWWWWVCCYLQHCLYAHTSIKIGESSCPRVLLLELSRRTRRVALTPTRVPIRAAFRCCSVAPAQDFPRSRHSATRTLYCATCFAVGEKNVAGGFTSGES